MESDAETSGRRSAAFMPLQRTHDQHSPNTKQLSALKRHKCRAPFEKPPLLHYIVPPSGGSGDRSAEHRFGSLMFIAFCSRRCGDRRSYPEKFHRAVAADVRRRIWAEIEPSASSRRRLPTL